MKLFFTITWVSLITINYIHAQNLVPNPSLENVTAEPYFGCELPNAVGWLNPSGSACPNNGAATPDLFSTLSSGQAKLPNTFMGYTNAHTGNRISGLVTYRSKVPDYREYMQVQLISPLVPGVNYEVSFWLNGGKPVQYIYHSNNIELLFSSSPLVQNTYEVLAENPQFTITNIVADSTWTQYTFQFTPTQPYSYLAIGNFKDDNNTLWQTFGTNRPYAYYFFDDFSVTPTSLIAFNDTAVCNGGVALLSAYNSATGNYQWYKEGSPLNVVSTDSVFTTPAISSNTNFVVTDGVTSDTISVSIIPNPSLLNIGGDTTYCGNFSTVLSTGDASTVWSTGVTASQIIVTTPGTYYATISNVCGSGSDTIVIAQLAAVPSVDLGSDLVVCSSDSVQLLAITTAANYLWSTGQTTSSVYVTSAGTYSVQVWDNPACRSTDTIIVINQSIEPFSLGNDTSICGRDFVLTVPVSNVNYIWQDNTTDSVYHVVASGTYSVTVSNTCGSVSDAISIDAHPDECALLVPTGFTPNGDGKNDMFKAISLCPVSKFSMHVYNRWGELVYQGTDITAGWDGTYKGAKQPLSVFVYYMEYFNYCEQKIKNISGNVTLLR